jgi:hypothetical protein
MAVAVKFIFFWDVTPHNLAEVQRRFGVKYCLHHQNIKVNQASNELQTRCK